MISQRIELAGTTRDSRWGVAADTFSGECRMVPPVAVVAEHDEVFGLLKTSPRVSAVVNLQASGGRT